MSNVVSLPNVENLYNTYLREPVKVRLTPAEAKEVWLIFRNNSMSEGRFTSLKYRAFMQAALIAAIKGSEAMGWVETLFTSAYKPTASVQGIVKKLIQHGISTYLNKDEPPKLYRSVVSSISWQNKTYFELINQGIEL